jgi:hypothetical protein
MVTVNEGQIEGLAFSEEPRKDELGLLGIVNNQASNRCFIKELKSTVSEPALLMRVNDHVPWV